MRGTCSARIRAVSMLGVFFALCIALLCAAPAESLATGEKVLVPTVDKTISGPASVTVGDNVVYKVRITAPSNIDEFEHYPLLLTDVPGRGLVIDQGSVEARVDDGQGHSTALVSGYSVLPCANGLTVSFDDLKDLDLGTTGSLVVSYVAGADGAGTYENLAYALYPKSPGDLATEKTCDSVAEATFSAPLSAPVAEARTTTGKVVRTGDLEDAMPAVAACAGAALAATVLLLFVALDKRGRHD